MNANKTQRHYAHIVGVLLMLSVLNSTVLSWDFTGRPAQGTLQGVVASMRIIVPLIFLISYPSQLVKVANHSPLIVLMATVSLSTSLIDKNNIGLIYTLWTLILLLFLFIPLANKWNIIVYKYIIKVLLKYSYLIVVYILFLSVMNIDEFTMGKSFRIAFSNRTFYPYILLFHLMLVLIDRLSAINSLNSLQLLSILTVVFLTLISGRRAPLICEIFVIFIVFIKSKKRLYSVFSILILLIIILSIDFSGYATVERLSLLSLEDGKINEGPYSNSVGSRLELLSIFWSFWCQRPLFGWGLLGYEQLLALKSPVYAGYSPHNTFLGVLVEYGLIGLVVALRGLFKVVFIRKPYRVFNYVLLVIIAINIVEYNTIPSQIFFIPTLILPLLIYGLSKKV